MSKARFLYIFALVLMSLFLLSLRTQSLEFNIYYFFAAAYLGFILLSTLFSVDVGRSIDGRIFRHEGLLSLSSYIVILVSASKLYKFSQKHIYCFFASAFLISSYAIIQYFGFDPLPLDRLRSGWIRYAYSTLGNPNFMGSFLTLVLPLAVYGFLHTKRKTYLIISCVFYLTLLCTRTRGAWIGALFSGVLIVLVNLKNKNSLRRILVIFSAFLVITAGLNFYNNFETETRFTSIIEDARLVFQNSPNAERSGSTRIFIWKNSLKLIALRPLAGYGPDTFDIPFMQTYSDQSYRYFGNLIVDKAHNEYLQIAVTTGIPSLIAYLMLLLAVFVKSLKSLKKSPLIAPLLCSLFGYWIQAFFNISVVSVAPVYWAIMGILVGVLISDKPSTVTSGKF